MVLIGQEEAEQAFLSVCRQGRMPQAWILGGDVGIGKATLAYRIARAVLASGADVRTLTTLDVSVDHPVVRQISAQAHPDVSVLKRGLTTDKKNLSSVINVEDVRDVLHRLTATSGAGGYRVCLVDSADDLNTSSANALLKMIEEPPSKTLFLLISHRPGRLLPTIRSRCRRLMLKPLNDAQIVDVIESLGTPWNQETSHNISIALKNAEGSVQRVLQMLRPESRMLITSLETMFKALPQIDLTKAIALADTLNTKATADDLAIVLDYARSWVARQVHAINHDETKHGRGKALAYVEAWGGIQQEAFDAMTYNLDKRPLVLSLLKRLSRASHHTPQ
jgi:DNA polymerase-3 subunit delta'